MKRANLFIGVVGLLCVAFWSCLKSGSYETTYIIKPRVQEQSVGGTEPLEGVVAYAYEVDTLDWGIASYADAVAGIITHKNDPDRRLTEPDDIATPYDGTAAADGSEGNTVGWLQLPLGRRARMVVAVDRTDSIYGYTMQQPQLNLPRLYVSLIFQPWKEGFSYKVGNWSFFNEFYVPPTILKTYYAPAWQAEEGGEEQAFASTQVKAYAFLADTADWYIPSYDDAVAGRIVRKEGTEELTTPNFTAYYESDSGLYGMEVTAVPLMAVVVDRVNRIYAYTKFEPDLEGEPPTWPVVFRPWRSEPKYKEGDWQMVNDRAAPES